MYRLTKEFAILAVIQESVQMRNKLNIFMGTRQTAPAITVDSVTTLKNRLAKQTHTPITNDFSEKDVQKCLSMSQIFERESDKTYRLQAYKMAASDNTQLLMSIADWLRVHDQDIPQNLINAANLTGIINY